MEKKVGSTTYNYYYADGLLTRQTWGTNYMDFLYDESGMIYSCVYNGTQYYYVRNLQGDVTHILNANGSVAVTYSYDAWGKCTVTSGANNAIANANPIRYRGYYYDTDTGFYYLQSRYYDPAIKRFINADGTANLGANGDFASLNLYAYCGNNSIFRQDTNGNAWETIWDAISLVSSVAEVAAKPYDPWTWISLAGDTADVLIPFIGGIGETTRALKAASKATKTIDKASDAKKGWKVGEDITNLTKSGKIPSWQTLRSRYCKNKAHYFEGDYSDANKARMRRGLAPQYDDGAGLYSMELHHMRGREGDNFDLFFEVAPEEHEIIDPFRFLK